MSNQEYLSTLNKSQLKAVQSIEGPNLVIAGAGILDSFFPLVGDFCCPVPPKPRLPK